MIPCHVKEHMRLPINAQQEPWLYLSQFPRYGIPFSHNSAYWPNSHPTATIFIIWNGVCDYLLVINSKLGPISHRFWDMASFLLINVHFSYPLHWTPNLKMFPFTVSTKFCTQRASTQANSACKKFSSETYQLATIHLLGHVYIQTDRLTDETHTFKLIV